MAVRILKLESSVKEVTPQMFKTLDEVIEDASNRIEKVPTKKGEGLDPVYAQAALKCIDDALLDKGFLYPDKGLVETLASSLTPYRMAPARRVSFEQQPHNKRRRAMIAQKFPGPFYIADCDTACFIYLGVADRLQLPIHFIDLPGFNEEAGHNIVRWREGNQFIDWETMDGCVMSDDYYKTTWGITAAQQQAGVALTDLTSDQVLGYAHTGVAIEHAQRGDYDKALAELTTALQLFPQYLLACNNFAWYTAVGANIKERNHPEAIYRALFYLNYFDDPNVRDTLAAVYASAGMFKLAVAEGRAAVAATHSDEFQKRLDLYSRNQAFRESKESPANEVFNPN